MEMCKRYGGGMGGCFHLDRKTRLQRSHVFRLTGTAALHCRHSFVGGILPMANNRTHKECLSQNKMAALPEQNGR